MARQSPCAEALRSLRAIWVDAGAVAFRRAAEAAGVPDYRVSFELFDAPHGGIDYRYPLALAWLCERLV